MEASTRPTSLQTLGDAPTFGGGDVEMTWADVFSEQQDETFAFLAALDQRHEKNLDFERMRQETDLSTKRPCAQTQLPLDRRILKAAHSYDSIEVFVDGDSSRPVSDEGLYDCSDRKFGSPYRVMPCRPSCVLASGSLGGAVTARSARMVVFPTPPPSRNGNPSHDPAMASSAAA